MGRFLSSLAAARIEEVKGSWYDENQEPFLVPIDGIKAETNDAVLLLVEGEEIWIPKSQLVYAGWGEAEISPWIAEQVGL